MNSKMNIYVDQSLPFYIQSGEWILGFFQSDLIPKVYRLRNIIKGQEGDFAAIFIINKNPFYKKRTSLS